jgi:hypothetical protein
MARIGWLLGDVGPMGRSLAAIVLAGSWVSTWRPQVDPDAWWHIGVGESILATGAVPSSDPFSWLAAGDRFVAHSWLWDVAIATAHRAGGPTGTSLLAVPVMAIVVGLAWALISLVAPGSPPLARAGLILVALLSALPLWAPRAQALDVAFVLGTALVLARSLRSGERRALLTLPLIGLCWANLHGSAILGFVAMLGIAAVALPIGWKSGAWPSRRIGPLLLASTAGVAGTMLNPYGPWLLVYPFDRSVASAFSPEIVEWRSPEFGAPELVVARLLLVSVLIALPIVRRRGANLDPFAVLAAALWTFAALGAVRFLPIASALLVVAIAPGLDRVDPPDRAARTTPARQGPIAAVTAGAILAIVVVGWSFIAPASQRAAIAHRLPVAATEALESSTCGARVMPAYGWAGYVAWRTGRDVGAYGNSAEGPLREQVAVEEVRADPRVWLDRWEVGATMTPIDGPLAHWLDEAPEWRPAYKDRQAAIHVRAVRTDCQEEGS